MPEQKEVQPSVESILVVDDHNHVIGSVPRHTMREKCLCHRATYVFVFNSSGQLYVQERTLTKDVFPGMFAPATGGVVIEGESYDEAAVRELTEELGIDTIALTPHFHFSFHDESCHVWGRVYSCHYDGPLTLQEDEVAGIVMEFPDDILSNRFHRHYTPDGLVALERLVHRSK